MGISRLSTPDEVFSCSTSCGLSLEDAFLRILEDIKEMHNPPVNITIDIKCLENVELDIFK